MSIEGALPYARPSALDTTAMRSAVATPASPPEAWGESRTPLTAETPRQSSRLRGSLSVLHHRGLQNLPNVRARTSPIGCATTDSQLASALEKDYYLLCPFLKECRLTLSSLHQFAAEPHDDCDERSRLSPTVGEILKRPRLTDAILTRDGDITRDSLKIAATAMQGSSSPQVFSQDPFHGKGNHEVVLALKELFEQLREPAKDRKFFFGARQYVAIAALKEVMLDPYEVDRHAVPVVDPFTGMPRPKYSERCVYMAKNLFTRPELMPSLERTNAALLFGPMCPQGYLSNTSLDHWLEQDAERKAR